MKSSTQVFASLITALAMFSQPAIATYIHADRQFTVDNNAINVGTKNRKSLLECSQSKPCVQDRIVIDSYKEVFSESGKLQEAKIVLYNTSFAPASIEVISSDGKLKSVEFVDGAKTGFKDLGDFLKTASAGLIAPFQCSTNLFECLSDSRYGIEKNERTMKLQAGDLIRISRGSDAAFAYTLASSMVDQVELFASIPGIIPSKVSSPSLLKNYSPELKRKIIEGFIKDKMNGKYTWKMLIKEFSYETFKKSASNPQELFNNALEITQNIPQDFWKKMMDGTVASTAAGDGLDTLIQAVGAEGAVFLNSSLLVSQSVNIRARYSASELAHDKSPHIIIAGLKNSPTNSNQPIATKPSNRWDYDKAFLKKLLGNLSSDDLKNKCHISQITLDRGGSVNLFIRRIDNLCGGGGRCSITIERPRAGAYQTILSGMATSPDFAVLGSTSNGWADIATRSYLGKEFWSVWKFDGKEYQVVDQRSIDSISNGNIIKSKSCSEVFSSIAKPTQDTQLPSVRSLNPSSKYLITNIRTEKGSKWQYFNQFEFRTKNKEVKKYAYTLVAKAKSMESTTYGWGWKFNSDGILRDKTLGDTLPEFKYVDAIGITDDGHLFINMNDKFKLLSPSQKIQSVKQLTEAYDRPQP